MCVLNHRLIFKVNHKLKLCQNNHTRKSWATKNPPSGGLDCFEFYCEIRGIETRAMDITHSEIINACFVCSVLWDGLKIIHATAVDNAAMDNAVANPIAEAMMTSFAG